MIVTTMQFKGHDLALIGGKVNDGSPKLLSVDWLSDAQSWQTSKSIAQLKNHFHVNDTDIKFIDQNSLSKTNSIQRLLIDAINQFKEYQSGERKSFKIPLDLSLGTEFQQKVWQALKKISYGQTISYSQLAQNIGKPTAYRAVANANGKNPFSIIIPCHRVIASDGGLGGYTGGLDKKRLLLQIEKQV